MKKRGAAAPAVFAAPSDALRAAAALPPAVWTVILLKVTGGLLTGRDDQVRPGHLDELRVATPPLAAARRNSNVFDRDIIADVCSLTPECGCDRRRRGIGGDALRLDRR